MKMPLVYTIQFEEGDELNMKLIKESPTKLVYRSSRCTYDLERNEKASLTSILELRPMTEEEIQLRTSLDVLKNKMAAIRQPKKK